MNQTIEELIRYFQLLYNPSKDSLLDELIIFMRKWIVTHIYDEDFKYVEKIQLYLIKDEITRQQKAKTNLPDSLDLLCTPTV